MSAVGIGFPENGAARNHFPFQSFFKRIVENKSARSLTRTTSTAERSFRVIDISNFYIKKLLSENKFNEPLFLYKADVFCYLIKKKLSAQI